MQKTTEENREALGGGGAEGRGGGIRADNEPIEDALELDSSRLPSNAPDESVEEALACEAERAAHEQAQRAIASMQLVGTEGRPEVEENPVPLCGSSADSRACGEPSFRADFRVDQKGLTTAFDPDISSYQGHAKALDKASDNQAGGDERERGPKVLVPSVRREPKACGDGSSGRSACFDETAVCEAGTEHRDKRVSFGERKLLLTEHANDFLEICALSEDEGGGFVALLKADPVNLCGDGATVAEALAALGARCAYFPRAVRSARREAGRLAPAAYPQPAPAQPSQPQWSYRRKTQDEVKRIARGAAAGTINMGYGVAAIERDWPVMVNELRRSGLNEVMHAAGVVAFFEDVASARTIGGKTTYLSADTLDESDYARVKLAMGSGPRGGHAGGAAPALKTATKFAELIVRTATRFLLAFLPRP